MEPWKIDVAVLLVFFVRDETFAKVFESVKQAKPRKLLLWQDGPRADRPNDAVGIKKCREIAESVDWDCEIHTYYNKENLGCDPSTFYAFKWAFSLVDKCIVLEDDQVPSQSYYVYCKELLDKYEFDSRVSHICGNNFFGTADWCQNDYLFAYTGTGAWASWKRVADSWDDTYSFLKDERSIDNLSFRCGKRSEMWIQNAKRHAQTGKEYWESIIGMSCALESRYAIIPKYNLVKNIGITDNATHSSVTDLRVIPKEDRQFYLNEAQELSFPLKHPRYVLVDAEYTKKLDKRTHVSKLASIKKKIEMGVNMIRYGHGKELVNLCLKKR